MLTCFVGYQTAYARLLAEAKQLAAKGAEVVQANAVDAAQRLEAFEGAYGVFLVTTGPEIVQQKPELEMGEPRTRNVTA